MNRGDIEHQAATALQHYRRRVDVEYGEQAQGAYAFLHGLMDEAHARGLPVAQEFETTETGDFQSIVFPAVLVQPWRQVLKEAGFELVPYIARFERDQDFWAKLVRGEKI